MDMVSFSKYESFAKTLERKIIKEYHHSPSWVTIINRSNGLILIVNEGFVSVVDDWKDRMSEIAYGMVKEWDKRLNIFS
jgi:hypothetical protein